MAWLRLSHGLSFLIFVRDVGCRHLQSILLMTLTTPLVASSSYMRTDYMIGTYCDSCQWLKLLLWIITLNEEVLNDTELLMALPTSLVDSSRYMRTCLLTAKNDSDYSIC